MPDSIARVHLIFKTHLDLGFTDLAREVTARYFDQYIPQALSVAEELRRSGRTERFVWTTGTWLIYQYLERAASAERARLEAAIHAGDIAWHALPFTTHSELMDPDLFRFGLSLAHELDQRFGKHTIAAKMTDVPGHTRGIVSLLAEAGVRFLHIGVNAASTPPAVPPVFVWQAPGGAEIIVMYQKGSYGDLQIVPGLDEALAFAHTSDNMGPQTANQVREAYAHLRTKFPTAEIVASTMDAFAQKLLQVQGQLPVVTREIGDTWIHGAASDPQKLSRYRQLLRLRRAWLTGGKIDPRASEFKNFSRALLQIPEHTWGLDVKTHLADYENYRTDLFNAVRAQPNFQKLEASWQEQRAYVDEAVDALGNLPLAQEARAALQAREPVRPTIQALTPVADPTAEIETRHWKFKLDKRGTLVHLQEKESGREWASATHPIGLFSYQTFSQADYDRFYKQYNVHTPENAWWSVPDFTKPGMALSSPERRDWYPTLQALYHDDSAPGTAFLLALALPEQAATQYGCPASVFLGLDFSEHDPSVEFTLQWFDKRACRLPEALWFSFCPRVRTKHGWTMDKLGQAVSPLEVVRDGNRHLHAVGRGVTYREGSVALGIETRDAPLVAPGERSLLNFNNHQPPVTKGMHFLLEDNVWGTNFSMWNEGSARFEFILRRMPAADTKTFS